ncbi:MAG: SlyX family protein [Myxococcaceae bacterium]
MSDALADVQVKCAYLEKTVGELSDVVWRQQQELDALKEVVRGLKDKLSGDPGLVDASRHDRPPHY